MARGRTGSATKRSEFLGLFAFAVAILVAISLLSFDPFDRSVFVAPSKYRGATRNLVGAFGANLAYGLYLAFGLVAWLTPALLVAFGVRRLRPGSTRPGLARVAGALLLWLSGSALLAVSLGDVRFTGTDAGLLRVVPIPAGGITGTAVAAGLGRWLNDAGSLVVLLTAAASALLLLTPISYARAIELLLTRSSRLQARLLQAWARYRERRRKARERAAVLARERASRQREQDRQREAETRRHEAEGKARDKLERERERALAEQRRAEQESARAEAERARKEREIAEAARLAAQARKTEPVRPEASLPPDPLAAGARLAPAAEAALLGRGPAGNAAPAAPPPEAAAPRPAEGRAAVSAEASRALARETAARAAAVTLRLDQPKPAAPAPAAGPAASPPSGHLATPRDVAALAAEASDAVRRAREAKADAEARKKPARAAAAPAADFSLPPLSLLETLANDAVVTERELVENAKVLVAKLKEFQVEGTVQAIHPGPVVTTYEYRPEAGVKYSKIVGLADDLCLAMKAEGVRIDRISGKSAVGIEVPNSLRETIGLREILESEEFQKSASKLTLSLGKSIDGETYITDLRKMPHLLIAGATGSGKSVAVNCMVVSILYKATPEEVRFIMVDPKRIELGVYDGIPHLLVPVVTDCRLAANALRWAVVEMENRYKRLASTGVRSLEQYNAHLRGPEARRMAEHLPPEELQPLPYIVVLIDELADLMMVAANDVEDSISRLAAMARAVGIHLVLATQRPSVDVITGVIKANFPSRISFRVSSKVDSRTILDSNGAEMLLGKGDMLFMPPGSARLQRVHGAFISDGEVQRLVNYLKNQREPEYRDDVLKHEEPEAQEPEGEMDEMYDEAVRVVLETGQASVSHLQRRLRLGYGRAARLVDMMELNGLVGPSQGAKGREILVDRASYLAQMGEAR